MGIIADRDISTQETCHMLQKLPLIICSRQFISLNAPPPRDIDDSDTNDSQHQEDSNLFEWEFLSQMGPTNKFTRDELQMLGRRDYDLSYFWPTNIPNQQLQSTAVQFICATKLQFQPPTNQALPIINDKTHLSAQQSLAIHIILHHQSQQIAAQPLRMIIQGSTGIDKSFLIDCIRQKLNISGSNKTNTLLVLAPIGVAAYNIQGTTIHAGLCIPIKEMHPLIGQALFTFQECFRHVKYLLIDEMSSLGPKLLLKIDSRLRQAFPNKQHETFGGLSMILVGDLGQLPPVMDKPAYASHSTALNLW
ncbi:ATP-dependent DNA helicase RRM3-like [Cryptomeria japonica]|uniref:ATP-dependent DNA helicase RRM3-like n=1 Tax=Cryptomeria japonica TaxID=3369 RepID=UPI0027DA1211|nr:ATP-dependent DNA helicase RRM3-like [Cryptomeria japonica]